MRIIAGMKSLLHIAASILIVLSTIGMSVSKHYCGEILMEKAMMMKASPCCDSEEMPEGCCHDEQSRFSIEDDYQLTQSGFHPAPLATLAEVFIFVSALQTDVEVNSKFPADSPPPLPQEDIYIHIQSFLI